MVDSPYREITKPIIDFVKSVRTESPRDVVTVFIPEYVVGHWWEHVLHNQSALRLKGRLLFEPGVMVVSVPWQLESSQGKDLSRLDLARVPARDQRASFSSAHPAAKPAETPPTVGDLAAGADGGEGGGDGDQVATRS